MGRLTCGTCGALLIAGVMVCEHTEPLVEGLLHHRAVITIGKEHPPEAERGFADFRLTYETSQASTSRPVGGSTGTGLPPPRRTWHPAYYASSWGAPILPLMSGST